MLELVLTRPWDYQLVDAARGLRFLVPDELHTYRGRQGADVAMLVRRLRDTRDSAFIDTLRDRLLSGSAPRPLSGEDGAAAALSSLTGVDRSVCEAALRNALLQGYLNRDENGRPSFAFRLHQFVSKGESVYASPEPEDTRHITLQAQQFVPGADRSKVLLPLAFCRECGQEYYMVRRT